MAMPLQVVHCMLSPLLWCATMLQPLAGGFVSNGQHACQDAGTVHCTTHRHQPLLIFQAMHQMVSDGPPQFLLQADNDGGRSEPDKL